MTKRLVVFNHKGGVSKTTSTYNIGWMMSKSHRVLLVDGDPQCNLTGLVLGDNFEEYYLDPDTSTQNIKDGVAPAFSGRPTPISAVKCIIPDRAPNLHVMAGHANLSEYDASLTFAQNSNNAISTLQNLPGAFGELLRLTEARYNIDYTIIDLNPGLSAINQNLFLSSDAFVVPTNPDPFSLMALETLKAILPRWAMWKTSAVSLFADSAYPLSEGSPRFLGSIIQRFNIRRGVAARPFRNNIDEINTEVASSLVPALKRANMTLSRQQYGDELIEKHYCLGQIPDFQGLLPKAHNAGVPVYELTDKEIAESGPVLANLREKRDLFRHLFAEMSDDLTELLEYA